MVQTSQNKDKSISAEAQGFLWQWQDLGSVGFQRGREQKIQKKKLNEEGAPWEPTLNSKSPRIIENREISIRMRWNIWIVDLQSGH